MSGLPTEESFLKDVAEHKMTILLDQGVYRHLRFAKPSDINAHFELITGPGFLLYRGDMGCYEFERLPDMFNFFRSSELKINPDYWGEKLRSVSCFGEGFEVYDQKAFEDVINETTEDFIANNPEIDADELRQAVKDDVLSQGEFEVEARHAAGGFEFEGEQVFTDFFEHDLTKFTYHYIWCCYAIVWGIMQYDQAKTSVERPSGWYWVRKKDFADQYGIWEPAYWNSKIEKFSSVRFGGVPESEFIVGQELTAPDYNATLKAIADLKVFDNG
jgi:hypothetical protein